MALLHKIKSDALKIFKAALQSADPERAVKKHLSFDGKTLFVKNTSYNTDHFEKIILCGAGKASAKMAKAVEDILKDRISEGFVIVKYDHTEKLKYTQIVEAAHPIPDQNGEKGAEKLLEIAEKADDKTLIIFLVSGGGSALTPLPADGLSLDKKQEITGELLRKGASIHEINTVRKKLSKIKGGKFVEKAYPATVLSLILSDVVGDDLSVIASGMTVKDRSTMDDFHDIVERYGLLKVLPGSILKLYQENPESEKRYSEKNSNVLVATNYDALKAAKKEASKLGYNTMILSSTIEGDTKFAAHIHCEIARQISDTGDPLEKPACIISGGETTLVVKGDGKGGRNQEFALECVEKLENMENTLILSAGTDGTDGPTDAAGAFVDGETLKEGIDIGLDFRDYLKRNDSYNYFDKLERLIQTGPTGTNVMDIKIVLVR